LLLLLLLVAFVVAAAALQTSRRHLKRHEYAKLLHSLFMHKYINLKGKKMLRGKTKRNETGTKQQKEDIVRGLCAISRRLAELRLHWQLLLPLRVIILQ